MNRETVLANIELERNRQDEKWGVQDHNDPMWYVILGEEFGEVGRAIFDKDDVDHLVEELIQVAAVATAWVEAIGRRA